MAAQVGPEKPLAWGADAKKATSGAPLLNLFSGEANRNQGDDREYVVTEDEEGRTPLCSTSALHALRLAPRPASEKSKPGGPASGKRTLSEFCSSRQAQAMMVTAIWWVAAVYVTMMFKLATLALPPFTLTWMVNTTTGIIALLLSLVTDWASPPLPEMQREEALRLAALGLAQGCEFGCLNKSLQYLTVSERTMLQNINILLLMATAWTFGLEKMTWLRVVAGLLLCSGGVLQGLDSSQESASQEAAVAHVKGVAFMVTSMLLTAGKWCLVQLITQRSATGSCLGRMSKLQLAARVQPVSGLVCLGLAGLFEPKTLTVGHLLFCGVLIKVPLIACGITVIQCSELMLVQLTSAVAVGVLMNLHHIPMVLAGVVLFHDQVDQLGLCGFACCILGGLFYAGARYSDVQAAAAAETKPATEPVKFAKEFRSCRWPFALLACCVARSEAQHF